ncbi:MULTISPECIES: ClpXP protease specificity-enhancing factor [unclassified Halomonas]|uniref:ClpXP protease specificity-enhancing factor n=1 Tax=unclassified Halomonas TaxID=2609666 RepID=UPI00055027A5|nr:MULTISPECIES: ClpXP protease specificity-enhancing factor [unclassified Halomonas]CEP36621.1 Stringent starvation protein B [Halomonas sp. R57-5]
MKSSRPYLARALYEWLLDNELTPYLVVDATLPGVEVPRQFVQNGQIVLNVAPTAVRDLFMENQAIGFNARFGGQPMQVMIPTEALIAIYARENGAGMVFGHEPELGEGAESFGDIEDEEKSSTKPELSVTEPVAEKPGGDSNASSEDADKEAQAKSKAKKKPTLRVVK